MGLLDDIPKIIALIARHGTVMIGDYTKLNKLKWMRYEYDEFIEAVREGGQRLYVMEDDAATETGAYNSAYTAVARLTNELLKPEL